MLYASHNASALPRGLAVALDEFCDTSDGLYNLVHSDPHIPDTFPRVPAGMSVESLVAVVNSAEFIYQPSQFRELIDEFMLRVYGLPRLYDISPINSAFHGLCQFFYHLPVSQQPSASDMVEFSRTFYEYTTRRTLSDCAARVRESSDELQRAQSSLQSHIATAMSTGSSGNTVNLDEAICRMSHATAAFFEHLTPLTIAAATCEFGPVPLLANNVHSFVMF